MKFLFVFFFFLSMKKKFYNFNISNKSDQSNKETAINIEKKKMTETFEKK